jgi:uncharacterized protein
MEPTIQTFGGRLFNFRAPDEHDFDIEEIAHALSNLCRFTGHVHNFYSVAQHSVLVSLQVPPAHAKAGLLHDAHEAYVNDISAPLKMLLPDYRGIEQSVEAALRRQFDVPALMPACVKTADLVALNTERLCLMTVDRSGHWDEVNQAAPLPGFITPLPPKQAFFAFMDRWQVVKSWAAA